MEGDSSHDWSFENNDDGEMHLDVDSENNVRILVTHRSTHGLTLMHASTYGASFDCPDGFGMSNLSRHDACTNSLSEALRVFPRPVAQSPTAHEPSLIYFLGLACARASLTLSRWKAPWRAAARKGTTSEICTTIGRQGIRRRLGTLGAWRAPSMSTTLIFNF
jgi:hypothetical protein